MKNIGWQTEVALPDFNARTCQQITSAVVNALLPANQTIQTCAHGLVKASGTRRRGNQSAVGQATYLTVLPHIDNSDLLHVQMMGRSYSVPVADSHSFSCSGKLAET